MMRRILMATLAAGLLSSAASSASAGQVLFYSGDPNLVNSYGVGQGGVLGDSFVFEQFNLASAATITELFGNFEFFFPPSTANWYWEIRQGMAVGDGGTVVASGTEAAAVTPSGSNYQQGVGALVAVGNLDIQSASGDVLDDPGTGRHLCGLVDDFRGERGRLAFRRAGPGPRLCSVRQ